MFAHDQIILVTGASSGIGRACAQRLNALGATVLACARNRHKLEEAGSGCRQPANWINVPRDLLASMESLPGWIDSLRQEYGKLWGLCHCAGTGRLDSIRSVDMETAHKHFDINFFAPLMLARGFSDRRNFRKGGAMLFITSIAGVQPEKGHCLYGAAKSALAAAIRAISQETAPLGLRAHCIAPGLVRTPMFEESVKTLGDGYEREQVARYPLGLGQPEDVAETAAFLLSDKARWITGQNFILAGGCI